VNYNNEELPPWENDPGFDQPTPEYTPGKIGTATEAKAFMLAGNATLTLVSKKTSVRFTYKVTENEKEPGRTFQPVTHMVKLLTNPDNEQGYSYLGHIYHPDYRKATGYVHGDKSKIGSDAGGARAFRWFYDRVIVQAQDPEACDLEVWHEGRCGKCGRKLTVPESIERGIGPECYSKMSSRGEL
jgi:hypothetical protein